VTVPEWLDEAHLHAGGDFLFADDAECEPVWGHGDDVLWAANEGFLIAGPTGVGKTTLTNQLVLALIGLRPPWVLGFKVHDVPRKVLYLAGDRPHQWRGAMRRCVDESEWDHINEWLTVWRGPSPQDIARHPDTLVEMAWACGADVVIVDSLKDAALRLSDDDTGGGIHRAVSLCITEGIQVLILHHQRKGQDGRKPNTIEDVYGSTWIVSGQGSVVLLWGEPGSPIVEMMHLKQPRATLGPFTVEHDHLAGTSKIIVGGLDPATFVTEAGATAPEIAKKIHGAEPSEAQMRQVTRRLNALVGSKLRKIEMVRGGPGGSVPARYFPLEQPSTLPTEPFVGDVRIASDSNGQVVTPATDTHPTATDA
jgi:replicative DNA helicase